MLAIFRIIWNSFKMALQELQTNKLRTFLSLFGITIGIFCIITVLATVSSLEHNIKTELKSLGTNTIYVQKWPWGGGTDYPWWKYAQRPAPTYAEMRLIKERAQYAAHVAFILFHQSSIGYKDIELQNVPWYGVTEEYNAIQPVDISYGRYLSLAELNSGAPVLVIGYQNAEKLFNAPENAVGKIISLGGRKLTIIGVVQKQGKNLLGGWDFDNIVIIPYSFCKQTIDERSSADKFIMIKGKERVAIQAIKDELTGIMRALRTLSPKQEDDFALNDITAGSAQLNTFFSSVNIGGWAIATLSLIVGAFGVANIMFVTVRERTSHIGLKKAIGAKQHIILTEFLLESAFLCIVGGLIGLILVYGLTQLLTSFLHFPITISFNILLLAIALCVITGVLAGIIPASVAARMDPAMAIRKK